MCPTPEDFASCLSKGRLDGSPVCGRPGSGAAGAAAGFGPAASAPPLPQADEAALAQLQAMGFDRARATAALQQCGSDLQDALALLL